ncbi:hypothetical protein DM75_3735 [Burkholderia mallei]|nr:hypothetical protein DM75_3735 [Burkholderia mallei]
MLAETSHVKTYVRHTLSIFYGGSETVLGSM